MRSGALSQGRDGFLTSVLRNEFVAEILEVYAPHGYDDLFDLVVPWSSGSA